MFNKALKTVFVTVIGSALLLVGGCGKNASQNFLTVGPEGPTKSGYYFKMMASPEVVQQSSTVQIDVWVTDGQGNVVNGTVPPASGGLITAAVLDSNGVVTTPAVYSPLPIWFGGSGNFTASTSGAGVDAKGHAGVIYKVSAITAGNQYLSATLEDRTLIIPIQILP